MIILDKLNFLKSNFFIIFIYIFINQMADIESGHNHNHDNCSHSNHNNTDKQK
jgi:hypothetical protein